MKMTANRRIWLNVAATYARNAYSLALGLVTARWLLLSLGQTDYGLFGVVGGLIAFVTFFNRLLAGAVARFYAIAIGQSKRKGNREAGLQECRRWFTAAVSVHTVVPLVLVAIGLPLGTYAVDHWLVIPADRVVACHWVWRFACLTALVGMTNVPFRAMYTAKQEIAELTVLNVMNATLNAGLLYYMVSHPGDWLARYAFWHCLLAILPRLFICARALVVYPECRLRRECLWNFGDIRRMAAYAGWNAFGSMSKIVRGKGMLVLVNQIFGPEQNAAVTVATRFASRTNTFAQSVITSISPAIIAACGAGQRDRMRGLVLRVSKLSGMLVVLVSLPLVLEMQEVMRIWLKNPPAGSPFLCSCVLAAALLNKMSSGEWTAISASGKVGAYQLGTGLVDLLAIPVAWLMMWNGWGLASVGYVTLGGAVINAVQRVIFAHRVAGVSAVDWIRRVLMPLLVLVVAGFVAAAIPRFTLDPSFGRIVLTILAGEAMMLPLCWLVIIDAEERAYLRTKSGKIMGFLKRKAVWIEDIGALFGGGGIRILMARNPTPKRDGNEMFFVSTLQTILKPFGYRVRMSVSEFWSPSRKYDIVHVHWPHMLVNVPAESVTARDVERIGKRIAELKSSGTALVYTRHNETSHYCSNPNVRRLYQLFEQESDRVIHMGRCSLGQVGGGNGERDVVIPHHGFDGYPTVGKAAARAELGIDQDVPVVAAMGSFRIPDERALVVGGCLSAGIPGLQVLSSALFTPSRGESHDKIDELRRRLGGHYPRQPEGWVSVADLSRSFAAADVVLIQHVQTLNSGNLPLGFHFGRVVVGPDCGNVGEILRETGNPVFDPRDEASVARALKSGFELARRGKGDENARYAREHWNFQLIAKAHDELYKSALPVCPILHAVYADIPNMGDQLNPLIVDRLFGYGIVRTRLEQAEVFLLGSFLGELGKRKSRRQVAVWGTGFISYEDAGPAAGLNVDYRAVRGNLTKQRLERRLGRKLDLPTADPGLLSALLLDQPVAKEYDLGVIAHFRERHDPRFAQLAQLARSVRMIDVTQDPLTVIRQIASCRRILSSSLHGLIISDSLGIPNLHVKVTDNLKGDGFKFDDYYSAFDVPHEFVDLREETIESLDVIDRRYRILPEAVAAKQRQLLEAFPFPKVGRAGDLRVSAFALLVPWGILRLWARRRFGVKAIVSGRRTVRFGLKRMLKFGLPFGVVAGLRARRFNMPMASVLSGGALIRTLNWRW